MDPEEFNRNLAAVLSGIDPKKRKKFIKDLDPLLRRAARVGLANESTYQLVTGVKAQDNMEATRRSRAELLATANPTPDNFGSGFWANAARGNVATLQDPRGYDTPFSSVNRFMAAVSNPVIATAMNRLNNRPDVARAVIDAASPDDPLSLLTASGAGAPTAKSAVTLRTGMATAKAGAKAGSALGPLGALAGGIAGGFAPMLPFIDKPIQSGVDAVEGWLYGQKGMEAAHRTRAERMQLSPRLGLVNEMVAPLLATGKINPAHLKDELATARTLASRQGGQLLRAARASGSRASTPESIQAAQRIASLGNTAAMTAMGIHSAPEGTGPLGMLAGGLQGLVSTPRRIPGLGHLDTALGLPGGTPPKPRVASMRPEPVPAETPAQRPVRGLLPPGPSEGRTTVQGDGFVMNPVESNPSGFHSTDAVTPPVRVPLPGSNGSMHGEFPPMFGGELPYRALQAGILPVPGGLSPRPGAAPLEHTVASIRERNRRALGFDPATSATPPAEGPSPIGSRPGSLQPITPEVSNVRPGMTEADAARFATPPRPFKMPELMPVPEALPEPPATGRNKLERGIRPYKPGPRRITNRATIAAETPPADLPVPEVAPAKPAPAPKPAKTSNVRGSKPTIADFMSRDPQPPPTDAQIEAQLTERGKFNKATDERLNGGEASNVRSASEKTTPESKSRETFESLDAQHKEASETLTKARASLAKAKKILADPNAKLDAETRTHLEEQVGKMEAQVKEFERAKKNLASRKSKLKPAEEKEVDARPKPGRLDDTSASIIEERNQRERAKAEAQQPVVNRVDPKTVEYSPAPTLSLRVDTKLENTEWSVQSIERVKPDANGMMLARGADGGKAVSVPYREGAVDIIIRRRNASNMPILGAGVDKAGNIVTHDGMVISTEKSHTPESIAKKNEDVAKGKEGGC